MGILANENAISAGGYQISNSLRFQSASSQYLNRTATSGNRQKWTWSGWVKRGTLGSTQILFVGGQDSSNYTNIYLHGTVTDAVEVFSNVGGATAGYYYTVSSFRDPASWYHIIVVCDTTNAGNKITIYVNNVAQTLTAPTTFSLNANTWINSANTHRIGVNQSGAAANYFDGYLAEVNFIDGQALTPSSFGSTDPISGQWVAAKYTGTYGTNGFYLPFSNGTSTTTLGADSSGNGNNWTLTNFTRSAGVSDCWMTDVPSGNSSTGGNYNVLNPLNYINGSAPANANLYTANGGSGVETRAGGTIGVTSGKWYFESTIGGTYCNAQVGIHDANSALSTSTLYRTFVTVTGQKNDGSTSSAYGSAAVAGNVIGCAIDMDNGKIWWSINNTWQASGDPAAGTNPAFTGISGTITPFFLTYNNGSGTTTHNANFGQRSFAYTPPTGFKALCTANLPAATIKKGNQYMTAVTYTGNANSQTVSNGQFYPDLAWFKCRSAVAYNALFDSVRGANSALYSNVTNAQDTGWTGQSFTSTGFTVNNTWSSETNYNGQSMVAWMWNAGSGTTSSNTNGSITSTVSVNATAGFSVVTYTGTGANATVGHGLGVAPSFYIVKRRNAAGDYWCCYHVSIGATKGIYLNTTDAAGVSNLWNNTAPTSSVFNIATTTGVNASGGTYVAYCFAEISGFSKFGSYTGNGSTDGPFVYCGFRPKYIMLKSTTTAGSNWWAEDTSRSPYNAANALLFPNLSNAEYTTAGVETDILSNGFKLRTTNGDGNKSGDTFIFMAFAENPFAQANAR